MIKFYPTLERELILSSKKKFFLYFISLPFSLNLFAQPNITSFSPTSGSVGTTVNIEGTNFNADPIANTVYFGGVKAKVIAASSSSLLTTVPQGAAYQHLTVTVNGLTCRSTSAFNVTFPDANDVFLESSFAPKLDFTSGSQTVFTAAGDLDGDGKADVVSVNKSANSISVFRNTSIKGLISFSAKVDYAVGAGPVHVSIADLDGDGMLDVIVTNESSSTLSVFRNLSQAGNIVFAARQNVNTLAMPNQTAVDDLNGDGKPELVINCVVSELVRILSNVSTVGVISFGPGMSLMTGTQPSSIAIGDMDRDGKLDIAVSRIPYAITLFRNISFNNSISFATKIDVPVSAGTPNFILVEDLDRDSKPEIIFAAGTSNRISYLKNNSVAGGLAFESLQFNLIGDYPYHLTIGDLNGDGNPDLLTANFVSKNISVLKNAYSGSSISFATKADFLIGNSLNAVCVADIDGDGKPDLIASSEKVNSISVMRNKINEPSIIEFAPATAVAGIEVTIRGTNFKNVNSVTFGGQNASSFTVLSKETIAAIIGNDGASGNISVTNANGSGELGYFEFLRKIPPTITGFAPESGPVGSTVIIQGDNFDATPENNIVFFGKMKAKVTEASSTSLSVLVPHGATYELITVTTSNRTGYSGKPFKTTFSNAINPFGPTSFSRNIDFDIQAGINDLVQADFDGDGKLDLVTSSSNAMHTFRNISTSEVISFEKKYFQESNSTFVTAADIEGDGKQDLIVIENGGVQIWQNSSVPGTISFKFKTTYFFDYKANSVSIGDIDLDGKPDMAITLGRYANADIVTLLRNTTINGNISFAPKIDFAVGKSPSHVCIADMDGDRKQDLVVSNAGDNSISVLKNTTVGYIVSFAPKIDYTTGINPGKIAITDLDHDNKPDVAVINKGTFSAYGKTLSVFRNESSVSGIALSSKNDYTTFERPVNITTADLDGDEKPELVIMSQAQASTLSIFKNIATPGNISFAQRRDYTSIHSLFSETIVVGDINNDSYPDLITNSSSSVLTVLRNQVTELPEKFTPPVITSFSPASAAIGASVTIKGNNFSPNLSKNFVYFGDVKAVVSAASPTSLTAIVPSGATYKSISVTRDSLTAYSSNAFNVTFPENGAPFDAMLFDSTREFLTISNPKSISSSDLDGDGKSDLVIAGRRSISVHRNTSSINAISFVEKSIILSDNFDNLFKLVVADINGDGRKDLIVAAHPVRIMLNTSLPGSISFEDPVEIGVGQMMDIDVADIDGDGYLDIVAAYSSSISIYRNISVNKTVLFYLTQNILTGYSTIRTSVTVGDINGDGKPDIITCNSGDHNISILKNRSTPGVIALEPKKDYPAGENPYEVSIADVNGDGKLDLTVVDYFKAKISTFRNASSVSSISLEIERDFPAGRSPYELTTADLNGDNHPDVAVVNQSDSTISVYKNVTTSGNIAFEAKADYKVGVEPVDLIVVDLDGDGIPDIGVANRDSTFSILRSNIYRPVITSFSPDQGPVGTIVTIKGFNFNGTTAVTFGGTPAASFNVVSPTTINAVAGEGSNGAISIMTQFGTVSLPDYNFSVPTILSVAPTEGPIGTTVTITGNHFSVVPENNSVYFGGMKAKVISSTTQQLKVIVPAGANYQPISVTAHRLTAYSSRPFSVMFNTGISAFSDTSFAPGVDFTAPSPNSGFDYKDISVGDLDGDNKMDVALCIGGGDNTPTTRVYVFRNAGDGQTISFDPFLTFNTGRNPHGIAIADIDGDGKLDIITSNDESNAFISVLKNTSTPGSILFAPPVQFPFHTWGKIVSITTNDFDKDGKTDIAVVDNWNSIIYLRNNSTGEIIDIQHISSERISQFPNGIVGADFNGDDKVDLATSGNSGGLPMSGIDILTNQSVPKEMSFARLGGVLHATNPKGISIGDYDGDNKIDIVSSQNSKFFAHRNISSIDKILFSSGVMFAFGNISLYEKISTGDLDGDGRPDIMISSGSDKEVAVCKNNSTSGEISFLPKFGLDASSYQLTLSNADFNEDGKPDIIVYKNGLISVYKNNLRVLASPRINSFSPTRAPAGTAVTIHGENLSGTNKISFGGVDATSFVVNSSISITAIVEAGASGDVVVSTSNGSSSLSGFTFLAPPTITSFTPTKGRTGDVVIITGTNFSEAISAKFGGVEAASFTIDSSTSIAAIVGDGLKGDVSVTTPYGTASLGLFIYEAGKPDNAIVAYPNPADDFVFIRHPSVDVASQIKVIDLTGRVAIIVMIEKNKDETRVDLRGLKPGIYEVVWSDGRQKRAQRIFKR